VHDDDRNKLQESAKISCGEEGEEPSLSQVAKAACLCLSCRGGGEARDLHSLPLSVLLGDFSRAEMGKKDPTVFCALHISLGLVYSQV
jgi:hypothetical protein